MKSYSVKNVFVAIMLVLAWFVSSVVYAKPPVNPAPKMAPLSGMTAENSDIGHTQQKIKLERHDNPDVQSDKYNKKKESGCLSFNIC